jgi:hypothetical protein
MTLGTQATGLRRYSAAVAVARESLGAASLVLHSPRASTLPPKAAIQMLPLDETIVRLGSVSAVPPRLIIKPRSVLRTPIDPMARMMAMTDAGLPS